MMCMVIFTLKKDTDVNTDELMNMVSKIIDEAVGKMLFDREHIEKAITTLISRRLNHGDPHKIHLRTELTDDTVHLYPGNLYTAALMCSSAEIPSDLPEEGSLNLPGRIVSYSHKEGMKVTDRVDFIQLSITLQDMKG